MTQKYLPILLTVFVLFFTQQTSAKIWRVNNNGYSANFNNLQEANNDNNVRSGDTVHMEGSATSYGSANISKRLVILGPGYFLLENPGNSVNAVSATLSAITFADGSQGSQMQGMYVGGGPFGITVSVSNILIKRCKIDFDISLAYAISDIRILQDFFTSVGGTSSLMNTSPFGFPTDVIFNNNIARRPFIIPDGYTLLECNNNVFDGPALTNANSIFLNSGTFRNNIITNPAAKVVINNGSMVNVSHNISASTLNQLGTSNNNSVVTNRASLFVDQGNSTDGNYQLRAASAGTANGYDGTDRGVFGGLTAAIRYTVSGLPPIPVIYEVTTTGVATPSGLPITIKARTIK